MKLITAINHHYAICVYMLPIFKMANLISGLRVDNVSPYSSISCFCTQSATIHSPQIISVVQIHTESLIRHTIISKGINTGYS